MKKTRTLTIIVSLLMLAAIIAACAPPAAQPPAAEQKPAEQKPAEAKPAEGAAKKLQIPADKLRVAILLDGPVNDGGWNQGAYDGLTKIKAKYPKAETAYTESVPRADMITVFSDYAARGYNIVMAHGYEFSDAGKTAAAKYPDTIFIVTHGTKGMAGNNVATIQFEEEKIGFVLGTLAGQMTKSNKIAAVGGYEIPAISTPFKAFALGVKEVNPKAVVSMSWIDSWTDVAKMKEAAKAAIGNGADIVLPVASGGSPGGFDAAQEANVWAVGYSGDQSVFAPKNTLASAIVDTGKAIELTVTKIVDGTFEPKDYWFGIKEGVLYMTPFYSAVPKEVQDSVTAWGKKIESGEYVVPFKMEN